MIAQIQRQKSGIYMRLAALEELYNRMCVKSDARYKAELVELYYLRDIQMGLDAKWQIQWAIDKLQRSGRFGNVQAELAVFDGTYDNLQFYEACTFEELMYLGY